VGAEFVATGHYARIAAGPHGRPALWRGVDDGKDQSYVLFASRRPCSSGCCCRVGDFRSSTSRPGASAWPARGDKARQPGDLLHPRQRSRRVHSPPPHARHLGEIVTTSARSSAATPGWKRSPSPAQGLGIAFGEPRFVVRIEPDSRRVVVGTKEELGRGELTANRTNWFTTRQRAAELPGEDPLQQPSRAGHGRGVARRPTCLPL